MSLDLRRAFGHYATGVTIVTTTAADGRPVGMTANSFSSLSLDPPLVLWSIARTSTNFECFRAARFFAVHVLHSGQAELARQFAARDIDRFEGVAHSSGTTGAPILPEFQACFDCETHARYDGGDHLIIVGRVVSVQEQPGDPLIFHRSRFVAAHGSQAERAGAA